MLGASVRLLNPATMAFSDNGTGVARGPADWAKGYFTARPDASTSTGITPDAAARLWGLQEAAQRPDAWIAVPDFDECLHAALETGGLTGKLSTTVREQVRSAYASAALEVAQHQELQRQRAAALLAVLASSGATPQDIRPALPAARYTPQPGDKTVGTVIASYRQQREDRFGATDKAYAHIFRALREVVGEHRPIRSITRDDVRDIARLLARVPANASKLYPGVISLPAHPMIDLICASLSARPPAAAPFRERMQPSRLLV